MVMSSIPLSSHTENMKTGIFNLSTLLPTKNRLYRAGVSNSRPSEPFSAASETIEKFLMNFGSIAMFHCRTNV